MVLLNAASAAVIAVTLPGALERQRAFNLRSSRSERSTQGDFDGRRSWALAYFRRNPGADPLQMIGDYNASAFGTRLGYFTLDEARAIAMEVAKGSNR